MLTLNNLPKIKNRSSKRVGRGIGSGKGGHTVGRGQKGQKTRGKIHPLFEGTKVKKSLIQRLPLMRGKGALKPKSKPLALSVVKLEKLASGAKVDVPKLVKEGIIEASQAASGVKIVGSGKISKKLVIKLPTTAGARAAIEEAGGMIETK